MKQVKFILVPLTAEDVKSIKPEHWLLLSPKKSVLHIPAAGGEYRRLMQAGYTPVKPYLVSDDEFEEGLMWDSNFQKITSYKGESKTYLKNRCKKVIATPEQIWGGQIIPFDDGIELDLTLEYMNHILRLNNGECKIQKKLVSGKVVIVI